MYYEDYEDKDKKNKNETDKEKEEDKEKQATTSIKTYYQFLLGLRTASSEIPKMGNVEYRGNWFGYISDGTTSYSPVVIRNARTMLSPSLLLILPRKS